MKCKIEGCDRKVLCKGICSGHYTQQRKGLPFTPLNERKVMPRDESGKVCRTCNEYKSYENFYSHKMAKDGYLANCKECQKSVAKANRAARQARANCAFEGCVNGAETKNLCSAHNSQKISGKELFPLHSKETFRDENGKDCTGCDTYKPYEEFYVYKGAKDGRNYRCKECVAKRSAERRKEAKFNAVFQEVMSNRAEG